MVHVPHAPRDEIVQRTYWQSSVEFLYVLLGNKITESILQFIHMIFECQVFMILSW